MSLLEWANETFGGPVRCTSCANYIDVRECKAFEYIPAEILCGDHDHTTPYPGDNGILYEKKV